MASKPQKGFLVLADISGYTVFLAENEYALFTLQGLEHTQVDKKDFVRQSESYEHLGNVETYIMELQSHYSNPGA